MDIFGFAAWSLVLAIVVTLLWPLNAPMLWIACKVRAGGNKLPYDDDDDAKPWFRFTFGSLGLAVLSQIVIGVAYAIIEGGELQSSRGTILLILGVVYVALAVGYLFWMLALEDPLQALAVFLLYILLPGVPLLLLGWLFGLWKLIAKNFPWMVL